MNQPAPKYLCEILEKMGCSPSSNEVYAERLKMNIAGKTWADETGENILIFFQNDFTGATDRARENAKIVWGIEPNHEFVLHHEYELQKWDFNRHKMIDFSFGEWWEFLERTMVKK